MTLDMEIIDAHAHILDTPGYAEKLLDQMDECGIQKACISGLGPLFNCVTNEVIKKVMDTHPDRFMGTYYLRPGKGGPDLISKAFDDGFRMLKVSIPKEPYDSKEYHGLWAVAERLGMPVLFHSGVVTTFKSAKGEGISSWNMHPMRIEPVAREFPDLGIIIAHLGVHWNDDAAELARMLPNVYVDLTGEPDGWRVRFDKEGATKWLWWPGAFKKVVFGTDVVPTKIKQILETDVSRLDKHSVDEDTREMIFSGNIKKLLGME